MSERFMEAALCNRQSIYGCIRVRRTLECLDAEELRDRLSFVGLSASRSAPTGTLREPALLLYRSFPWPEGHPLPCIAAGYLTTSGAP